MPILAQLKTQVQAQRGYLIPWVPVCLGFGIACYFSIKSEPTLFSLTVLSLIALAALGLACFQRNTYAFFPVAIFLISGGFLAALLQAHLSAAPTLDHRYYGPIYGRVIVIDRSSSDVLRLTLDKVLLKGMTPAQTPNRIRVSLHGHQEWLIPRPHQYVGLTGHLLPPSGPAEPNGFDFQRHAFFQQLGAVGYVRIPALEIEPPNDSSIAGMRHRLSQTIATYLGGEIGGFASAVTTGDRSGLSQSTLNTLRISNLAHLLAISGLHLGLLAAFVFGTLRFGLSCVPWIAHRWPIKKLAAIAAILCAGLYLVLSGGNIATQRAFIMAVVALGAVATDRRALTLRAVAIAAMIVLLLNPASLLSAGFHMSFAATSALVTVFEALRDRLQRIGSKWLRRFLTFVLSSAVAGAATAPFAAAHFNQFAAYGLLANLLAVPAMGMVVIPSAVLSVVLAPIGLEWIGLEVMGQGLRWILFIAERVTSLEGARIPVQTPMAIVLPLVAIGGLALLIWKGSLRWLGLLPICAAGWMWAHSDRPTILISDDAKLVGVLTEKGRALSKPKGQGFIASIWLENDGDAADQAEAYQRWPQTENAALSIPLQSGVLWHLPTKKAAKAFTSCSPNDLLVTTQPLEQTVPCQVISPETLKHTGAIAIWETDEGYKTVTANERRGQRLWTAPALANQ